MGSEMLVFVCQSGQQIKFTSKVKEKKKKKNKKKQICSVRILPAWARES